MSEMLNSVIRRLDKTQAQILVRSMDEFKEHIGSVQGTVEGDGFRSYLCGVPVKKSTVLPDGVIAVILLPADEENKEPRIKIIREEKHED